jgi:hypothetical protein
VEAQQAVEAAAVVAQQAAAAVAAAPFVRAAAPNPFAANPYG